MVDGLNANPDTEVQDIVFRFRQVEIEYVFPMLNLDDAKERQVAITICEDYYEMSRYLRNRIDVDEKLELFANKIPNMSLGAGLLALDKVEHILDIGKYIHYVRSAITEL